MHHQRIAAFVLGAWIMGSLFMIFVATQNFQMADALGSADTITVRAFAPDVNLDGGNPSYRCGASSGRD